eukprot:TRINITY_DN1254_c3_g2_i1.p1 TRINITY_DN1254_c3_g2~~TRINITY_DN1254_c3_g2_i1.p1  ORF type:complete len:316 (-),score=-62.22 TRINITY_DN1254_c3_g2_i1:61-1008(-)
MGRQGASTQQCRKKQSSPPHRIGRAEAGIVLCSQSEWPFPPPPSPPPRGAFFLALFLPAHRQTMFDVNSKPREERKKKEQPQQLTPRMGVLSAGCGKKNGGVHQRAPPGATPASLLPRKARGGGFPLPAVPQRSANCGKACHRFVFSYRALAVGIFSPHTHTHTHSQNNPPNFAGPQEGSRRYCVVCQRGDFFRVQRATPFLVFPPSGALPPVTTHPPRNTENRGSVRRAGHLGSAAARKKYSHMHTHTHHHHHHRRGCACRAVYDPTQPTRSPLFIERPRGGGGGVEWGEKMSCGTTSVGGGRGGGNKARKSKV